MNMTTAVDYVIDDIDYYIIDGKQQLNGFRRYSIELTLRLFNDSDLRQDLTEGFLDMNCQSAQLKKSENLKFMLENKVAVPQRTHQDIEAVFSGGGSTGGAFPILTPPAPPADCSGIAIKLRFVDELGTESAPQAHFHDVRFFPIQEKRSDH